MDLRGILQIAGRTDVGRIRTQNEDSIGEDAELGVVVLADGMGGYHGGEVASAIAVNTILNYVYDTLPKVQGNSRHLGYCQESLISRHAIERANETIFQAADNQPEYQGMGTTIVMGIFHDNLISVAYVGDSRMYRFRDNILEQLTVDHTLLQELVDRGLYTIEEAKQSLNSNLVTRALGIEHGVNVDVFEEKVKPSDIYLLCSDGLHDMVNDEEIHLVLKTFSDNLQNAADRLIEIANENGGKDNVSVILARPLRPFSTKRSWYKKLIDLMA